jgi:hypothetical protein
MHRRLAGSFAAAALCAVTSLAHAQAAPQPPQQQGSPPQRARNLKVLPADMPLAAVRDTMRVWARALGVRCSHCHVAREGVPGTPAQTDYVSDEKAEKEMARRMVRMVQVINREHLDSMPWRAEPEIQVTCETCHRGLAEPRPLRQVLLGAYEAGAWTASRRGTARCASASTGRLPTTSVMPRSARSPPRCARGTDPPTR